MWHCNVVERKTRYCTPMCVNNNQMIRSYVLPPILVLLYNVWYNCLYKMMCFQLRHNFNVWIYAWRYYRFMLSWTFGHQWLLISSEKSKLLIWLYNSIWRSFWKRVFCKMIKRLSFDLKLVGFQWKDFGFPIQYLGFPLKIFHLPESCHNRIENGLKRVIP